MNQVGCLFAQLVPTVNIAVRGYNAGATKWNELRPDAPCRKLGCVLPCDSLQLMVIDVTRPLDASAEQTVESDVAGGDSRLRARQHEHYVQAEMGTRCSREPGVIALGGADSHQRPRPVGQGRGAGVLQLADFVSATAQTDQVIALDPQIPWAKPQRDRQARRGLQGSGPGSQDDFCRCSAGDVQSPRASRDRLRVKAPLRRTMVMQVSTSSDGKLTLELDATEVDRLRKSLKTPVSAMVTLYARSGMTEAKNFFVTLEAALQSASEP
jgi:hypothetical protein